MSISVLLFLTVLKPRSKNFRGIRQKGKAGEGEAPTKAKMANLRSAMDAAFWDLNVASPQTFQGSAKHIPGDPAPMDGARAGRVLRIQQISLLRNGFPLGIIPSISPIPNTESGSFSLQSLLLRPATNNW